MTQDKTLSAHTKAPWFIEKGSIMAMLLGEKIQITCISPTQFCGKLSSKEESLSLLLKKQQEANTRLIAAAPEMLEALQMAILVMAENGGAKTPEFEKIFSQCAKIEAKAQA